MQPLSRWLVIALAVTGLLGSSLVAWARPLDAVETFEFIAELFPTMPPGAVGYTFLDVVDSMAGGQAGMTFYWGRVFGRAAEVNKDVFNAMEAYQHAAHPKTGKRRYVTSAFLKEALDANAFIAREGLVSYYRTYTSKAAPNPIRSAMALPPPSSGPTTTILRIAVTTTTAKRANSMPIDHSARVLRRSSTR